MIYPQYTLQKISWVIHGYLIEASKYDIVQYHDYFIGREHIYMVRHDYHVLFTAFSKTYENRS